MSAVVRMHLLLVGAPVDSGSHGTWAEGILASGSLTAPELMRVEATNILRRLERAQELSSAEANGAHMRI